jgi:uncharacterized protein (DUF302 family)
MPEGVQTCVSKFSVDESVSRLEALLRDKGIKLFALIDHSGEALSVGLDMPPTKVLIFGSPKAGTPLMLDAPSVALDLPLRILVAESPTGEVLLSWNDPAWLQQRYGFAPELTSNLAAAGTLAKSLSKTSS